MDIVLKIINTSVGDHVYAALNPAAKSLLSDSDPLLNTTAIVCTTLRARNNVPTP